MTTRRSFFRGTLASLATLLVRPSNSAAALLADPGLTPIRAGAFETGGFASELLLYSTDPAVNHGAYDSKRFAPPADWYPEHDGDIPPRWLTDNIHLTEGLPRQEALDRAAKYNANYRENHRLSLVRLGKDDAVADGFTEGDEHDRQWWVTCRSGETWGEYSILVEQACDPHLTFHVSDSHEGFVGRFELDLPFFPAETCVEDTIAFLDELCERFKEGHENAVHELRLGRQ